MRSGSAVSCAGAYDSARTSLLDAWRRRGTAGTVKSRMHYGLRALRLAGEVRWVNDAPLHAGMGIRFVNTTITERLRLANFVIHRTYRSL